MPLVLYVYFSLYLFLFLSLLTSFPLEVETKRPWEKRRGRERKGVFLEALVIFVHPSLLLSVVA